MLEFDELGKRYPGQSSPAVDGLTLTVRDGEILGFVGLNGAGKTTTIRAAVGVVLPTAGTVRVDGHDIVAEKEEASRHVGWVPELFPYDPGDRALPLLRYLASLQGIVGPGSREVCQELLIRVGLGEVQRGRIRTFSQGMKRRFGIATAMLGEPTNLLLDEVLNGLDPEAMAFVRSWLVELRRRGRAVLLSSHVLTELEALADRVAFIHRGRLLRTIDRGELLRAGGAALCLTVDNVDAAAVAYLETLGKVRVDGNAVRLEAPSVVPAEVNAELVRRGYRVSALQLESASLEEYFLQLIQAAR